MTLYYKKNLIPFFSYSVQVPIVAIFLIFIVITLGVIIGYRYQQNVIEVIVQQEKAANKFGFCWEDIDQVLDQVKNDCNEVKLAWLKGEKENLEEKIATLINATLSLTVFGGLNPVEVLRKNNKKFQKRFDTVVALVKKDGLETVKGQPLNVLLSYWGKAKQIASSRK